MSDGSISQDEIDALLAGVDMGGMGAAPSAQLKDNQVEALTSYIKANLPALKSNLESMTGETLGFESPAIEIMQRDDFLRKIPEMVVATVIDFNETLVGDHIFIMTQELAQKIVSLVNHEENADLDEMSLSVISETISQHVGIELTALEKAGFSGVTNNPAETVNAPKAMIRFPQQDFVVFTFPVTIGEAAFSIWEIMSYQIAMEIAKAYGAVDEVPNAGMGQMDMTGMQGMQQGMGGMQQGMPGMQQGMGGMQQQGMPGMQQGMGGMQGQVMGMNQNVQSVQFPNLQMNTLSGEQGNIGLIMDVFMEMTVELGRTRKVIKEILGMGEGTIIELDKLAGEPVDILVNHKPIAKGEVVVIDENFGVRVTEILSPIERVSEM
ncbi:MAG TPA: flagellar motor switch protein FliN [Treponema sp.]|nr:flagellar motor switch protein FliN [Treponema sp.]